VLAGQFLEMWDRLGKPSDFHLIEQGGNDGRLSSDILNALDGTPLACARLILIEPLAHLREKQAAILTGRDVRWIEGPEKLGDFQGIHFSNELFDALPFDILEARSGLWYELLVHADDEGFHFNPSRQTLPDVPLPARTDGFRVEIRRHQCELLQAVSKRLQRGFVLAIDYGMTQAELLAPHRSEGTLACYARHQRDATPLENPGEKDITAHVDFTALARDATACGLDLEGYTDQHHFLVGAATPLLKSFEALPLTPSTLKILRSLRTLLHPETMGTQFKSILFSKNAALTEPLSGFQHAKNWNYLLDQRHGPISA